MGRKIPIDKERAIELKKFLKNATNSIQSKRIHVMICYLNGNSSDDVSKNNGYSKPFVIKIINSYLKDSEKIYKTKGARVLEEYLIN